MRDVYENIKGKRKILIWPTPGYWKVQPTNQLIYVYTLLHTWSAPKWLHHNIL